MTNASTSTSFTGHTNTAAAVTRSLHVFKGRKRNARSTSCKPESLESHNLAETRAKDIGMEAFHEMFVASRSKFVAVAHAILRNTEDAEDAVQDGWCRAYSKLHSFQGRSSLSTWLTRIIINSALMIRRRNKHLQLQISLNQASEAQKAVPYLVDNRRTPEEACWDGEMNRLLAEQIHRLPSSTRTAFLLRDVDELTVEEATKLLGIKKSALKSRTVRARQSLALNMRQLLQPDRRRNRPSVTGHCSGCESLLYTISTSGL
jgi:RNA polymerase sigma-70 factor, ECF subfamily